jgi:hypothetical protein
MAPAALDRPGGGLAMGRRRGLLVAGLAWLLCAPPVRAQSVDYDGFEQLLGEPVTTTATGKIQRVSEVPANMEIITADDIRRSGADNLPDILQFVAGLSVRRYGFAAADVGIRCWCWSTVSRSISTTSAARNGTRCRSSWKRSARSRSSRGPTPRCTGSMRSRA